MAVGDTGDVSLRIRKLLLPLIFIQSKHGSAEGIAHRGTLQLTTQPLGQSNKISLDKMAKGGLNILKSQRFEVRLPRRA